jgi:predicted ArsR family transcriptional regulator
MDDGDRARISDAAQIICSQKGSVRADDVADLLPLDPAHIRDVLADLARQGDLIARPGGVYARNIGRKIRLPGASWPQGLVAPLTAERLMGRRA